MSATTTTTTSSDVYSRKRKNSDSDDKHESKKQMNNLSNVKDKYSDNNGEFLPEKYIKDFDVLPTVGLKECFLPAAKHGHIDVIEYIAACIYPPLTAAIKRDAICEAIKNGGHIDVIKFLVEKKKAKDLNEPVIFAAKNNQPHILRYLLENGGQINVYRSLDKSDMRNLLYDNYYEVIQILLDYDILLNSHSVIREYSDVIVKRGCLRIAQLFVDKFSNLNYIFCASIQEQKLEMIYFCLARKVVVTPEYQNINTSPEIKTLLTIFAKEQ